MSDDQGDAEFEASLADLGAGDGGRVDDGRVDDDGGVREVRRLFAGLHEDLLQIRAIARSIAERDLTEDVRAVRGTVEDLAARDVNAPVRDELSGLRDLVTDLQASDPVGELRAQLAPLRDGLDRISAHLADDSQHRRVLERIDDLERRVEGIAAADRSPEVLDRLDALATGAQVRGLAADLRAHLADAIGGLDGDALSTEMAQVRETVDAEAGAVADALQRLQETLLDVASGEVVGALWDELRDVRHAVESTARVAEAGGIDAEDVVAPLREELERLATRLERDDTDRPDPAVPERLDAVADDLAGLRAELREGLVLGPSDDLTGTLEALQRDIDGLRGGLEVLPTMQSSLDALRETIAALDVGDTDRPDPAVPERLDAMADDLAGLRAELREGLVVEPSDDLTGTLEALQHEIDRLRGGLEALPTMQSSIDALRSAVDGVQAQLDEGLVLADDVELPATGGDAAAGPAVADQIASLRDHLSTELDGLRASIPQGGAGTTGASAEDEVFASIDPDTIDLLRTEIRAAGSVPDQLVDALREELKALRRRLAVKAQEKVLSDDQLRTIADAVAERLGRD